MDAIFWDYSGGYTFVTGAEAVGGATGVQPMVNIFTCLKQGDTSKSD